MDYTFIHKAIIEVYENCNVQSFPIDCYKILDDYKMKYHTYSSQTPKKREKCFIASKDAFTVKNVIFYNDEMPEGRIRFTLMHELAHRVLKHIDPQSESNEIEANYFASHILAPRMAIHYSQCKNLTHVAKIFSMTNEAAQIAFDDYKRWHRWTVYHKMNLIDKAMYHHFYIPAAGKFVYNIKRCVYCDDIIYNSIPYVCKKCNSNTISFQPDKDDDLLIATSQWLYGGI